MIKTQLRLAFLLIILIGYISCNIAPEKQQSTQHPSTKSSKEVFGLIIPDQNVILKDGSQNQEVDKVELDKAIKSSANYLMDQINTNGYFKYRVNPNTKVAPMYNMLRHAGTIYSIMMFNEIAKDDRSCAVAGSAVEFLKKSSLGPVDQLDNMLGIWSFPDIVPSVSKPQLKLGGSGLGLVAMTAFERCRPGSTKLETLQQLGNFICHLQKDDGSFYSKYFPEPKGRDDSWTSLYYPGEAALGLCLLYEMDGNKKWLKASLGAMNNLYEKRKGKRIVEADHWALIATGRLLNLIRNVDTTYLYFEDVLLKHAVQICESMLTTAYSFDKNSAYFGCMTMDGRTTPTATRLEGLLAAYNIIPEENDSLKSGIRTTIEAGVRFLLNAQIKDGKYKGGIPRAYIAKNNIPKSVNQSDKRNTEIRIDYVQHALSAMIAYQELFISDQK